LVGYFGDASDSRARCGICDVCNPGAAVAQEFRAASQPERDKISLIVQALKKTDTTGTGKLYSTVFPSGAPDRRTFEDLLGAMARAGLVELADASFEKDGKRIDFRKVWVTSLGREENDDVDVMIPVEPDAPARSKGRKPAKKKAARKTKEKAKPETAKAPVAAIAASPLNGTVLIAALKAWRMAEAKAKGLPAFRILTDKTLTAIAEDRPQTTRELLSIPGIGLQTVEKYGAKIFRIVAQTK
jgi:superfamily II DNA helicase RecQ